MVKEALEDCRLSKIDSPTVILGKEGVDNAGTGRNRAGFANWRRKRQT